MFQTSGRINCRLNVRTEERGNQPGELTVHRPDRNTPKREKFGPRENEGNENVPVRGV